MRKGESSKSPFLRTLSLGFSKNDDSDHPIQLPLPSLGSLLFLPFSFSLCLFLLSLPFSFFLSPSPGLHVRHLAYYILACTHAHTPTITPVHTTTHVHTCTRTHTHTHTALVRQPEIHCPMRLTTDLCLCSPLAVPPHCLIPHGLQVTWAVLSFRKSSLSSSPVWTAVPPRSSPRALAYLSQHCLHCTVLLFAHPLSTPRGAGGY